MSVGPRWDLENQQLSHQSEKHGAFERVVHKKKKKLLNKHLPVSELHKFINIILKLWERKVFSEQEMANGN